MNATVLRPAKQRASPARYRWSREAYFELCGLGYFADERVELIDGEIIPMAARKNPHVIGVENTKKALTRAFGRAYWVRARATLSLGPYAAPDLGPKDKITPLAAPRARIAVARLLP